jgi:phage terminase small subunit
MTKEITTRISPESIEIANSYLETGNIAATSASLRVPQDIVTDYLNKREVKKYIDSVYLDTGYRNRSKLAEVMDTLIDKKLEEAEETEMYSNKDLADLLQMAHKMRMDELKAQGEAEKVSGMAVKTQNNVMINSEVPFGQGNYGALIDKLLKSE